MFLYYRSLWFTPVTGCTLKVKGISIAPLRPLISRLCFVQREVMERERGQRGRGQIQFIIPPTGRLKTTAYASALKLNQIQILRLKTHLVWVRHGRTVFLTSSAVPERPERDMAQVLVQEQFSQHFSPQVPSNEVHPQVAL